MKTTALFWKSMLTLPPLVGLTLACPSAPGLAEDVPGSAAQSVEAQSVPGSSIDLINPESPSVQSLPVSNQAARPLNPVVLSIRAADLQATDTPHPGAQVWHQQGQGRFSQSSGEKIAASGDFPATSMVDLNQVAAELATSTPKIIFPASPALEQMLMTSQDLIGCRVPGMICPSPNPTQYVNPAGSTPSPTQPGPTEPSTTKPDRWHFLFTPFVYLPITIYGDATVKGFDADISLGPSTVLSSIRNTLEFAFLGRTEAWTPDYRLGLILGGDYVAVGQNNTFTRQNSDRLVDAVINRVTDRIQNRLDDSQRQLIADLIKNSGLTNDQIRDRIEAIVGQRLGEIIPTQLRSDVKVQTWSIRLAAAYRFYNASQVNPKGVATEFDLGPFLVDVMGGLRLGGTSGEVDVTSNLGGEGTFNKSVFTVVPLIGVRFRYNAAHNLALVAAGSTAGFGIDTLWQWDAMGGVDWMFSGNTSLGVGWRFAGISYETGSGRDAFGVNLNNNGPYLSFTFRF